MAGMTTAEILRFQKNFNRAINGFEDWICEFILKEAMQVKALTIPRTPVRTGALRASWAVGDEIIEKVKGKDDLFVAIQKNAPTIKSIQREGRTFYTYINNGMFYATYVEYGTSRMIGRYMLSVPLQKVKSNMPNKFSAEFEKYYRSKMGG